MPIRVNTTEEVLTSISSLDNTWRAYANAARYMLETKKNYDLGLRYIDQSLALKEDWYNVWIKALLLAAKSNYKDAGTTAEHALELGLKAGDPPVPRAGDPQGARQLGRQERRRPLNDAKAAAGETCRDRPGPGGADWRDARADPNRSSPPAGPAPRRGGGRGRRRAGGGVRDRFRAAQTAVFVHLYRAPDVLLAFQALPPALRLLIPAAGGAVAAAAVAAWGGGGAA